MPIRPVDIMTKAEYDPDKDVKIALAQIADAACSEAEADSKITAHTGSASAHHAKTTKASEITSEHFELARMPDIALDKILVGQGAGSDPVAEDKPSSVTFTELFSTPYHCISNTSTWEDWDLSSIVPAGTLCVLVIVAVPGGTNKYEAGARKNGTALARKDDAADYRSSLLTEVDANRVIEVYGESTTAVRFTIAGYWS